MASGPNKTVGRWRQQVGFPEREPRPADPFIEWLATYARENPGPCPWRTVAEAREAYAAATGTGTPPAAPASS